MVKGLMVKGLVVFVVKGLVVKHHGTRFSLSLTSRLKFSIGYHETSHLRFGLVLLINLKHKYEEKVDSRLGVLPRKMHLS